MNSKKGFFLAFVIFLMGLAIILAGSGVKQTTIGQKQGTVEETAFDAVNTGFANIYNETLAVKTGYAGRLQSRILTPFEYDAGNMACKDDCVQENGCPESEDHDICPCTGPNASPSGCGWIEISQETPISSDDEQLKAMYDALNLYSIFVSDKNINGDLNITARAAKNSDWGGNDKFTYLILDECISYNPQPDGTLLQIFTDGEDDGCSFDISKIRMIDFNVTIPKPTTGPNAGMPIQIQKWEYYGDLGDGSKNPLLNEFLQSNANPYVNINSQIPIADCDPQPPCDLSCCSTEGSNHVGTADNYFSLKLAGEGYTDIFILNESKLEDFDPKVIIGMDNKADQHAPVIASTKIIFKEPIALVKFNAFDFNVGKSGFTNLKIGTS
ncbi:MAG: hypothetical protein PHD95_02350 [Candidatus ainarchaeum sp.]|nr:hypothetical protein [Candidatus ainarchaeum sp.]